MFGRPLLFLLMMATCACDGEAQAGQGLDVGSPCLTLSEAWLLPTAHDAKQLDDAFRSRNRGTSNLLLAKYSSKEISKGTNCKVLEEKDGLARIEVKPGGLKGWLPVEQLQSPAK